MTIDKSLANYLTIIRIAIIPIIILTFYFDDAKFAHRLGAILFICASITDFFDGYIARKFHIVSNFGEMFDPIADKLLIVSVIIMLVKKGLASEIPCLLIVMREFLISGLREFLGQIKVNMPVSKLGKVKTLIQMIALTILILGSRGSGIEALDFIGQVLLWISAILTVITGILYILERKKYFTI